MNVVWGENAFSEDEKPTFLKILRNDEDDTIPYLKDLNEALLKENHLLKLKIDILETFVNIHSSMNV